MKIDDIKTLRRIKIEDYIWIIYIFIIAFNIYSNYLEKNYVITKNKLYKNKFRNINKIVLSIILIIYIYYVYIGYLDMKDLKVNDSLKKKRLTTLALVASILFLIGGAISLYVTFKSDDLEEEIPIL